MNYFARSLVKLYRSKFNNYGVGKLIEPQGGLYSKTQVASQEGTILVLFYPELLSETSLGDLKTFLSSHPLTSPPAAGTTAKMIHILSFFSSIWTLQELKSHP